MPPLLPEPASAVFSEAVDVAALEALLGEAVRSASRLPDASTEHRAEHVGMYLLAQFGEAHLPESQPPADGLGTRTLPAESALHLEDAVHAAAVDAAARWRQQHQQQQEEERQRADRDADARRFIGFALCPRAAPIPADAYLSSYPLCRVPPFIIQIDEFLNLPGPGYHFSMPRIAEAKRQSWELIKHMQRQGRCNRLVLMSGNPAVGKSTWVHQVGAREMDVETTIFFDDLLNNRRRRDLWWQGFREAGVPDVLVEVVAITRDFERALSSNTARGAKGGHLVPRETMERYAKECELPELGEGFARVRIYDNEYNDEGGEGGYVLTTDVQAGS